MSCITDTNTPCNGNGEVVLVNNRSQCQCWTFPPIFESDGSPSLLAPNPCCFGDYRALVPMWIISVSAILLTLSLILLVVSGMTLRGIYKNGEFGNNFRTLAFSLLCCYSICMIVYWGVDPLEYWGVFNRFTSTMFSVWMDVSLCTAYNLVFIFWVDLTSKTLHKRLRPQQLMRIVIGSCCLFMTVVIVTAFTNDLLIYAGFFVLYLLPFALAFLYYARQLTARLRVYERGNAGAVKRITMLAVGAATVALILSIVLVMYVVRSPALSARDTVLFVFGLRLITTGSAFLIALTFWRPKQVHPVPGTGTGAGTGTGTGRMAFASSAQQRDLTHTPAGLGGAADSGLRSPTSMAMSLPPTPRLHINVDAARAHDAESNAPGTFPSSSSRKQRTGSTVVARWPKPPGSPRAVWQRPAASTATVGVGVGVSAIKSVAIPPATAPSPLAASAPLPLTVVPLTTTTVVESIDATITMSTTTLANVSAAAAVLASQDKQH